VVVIEVDAIAQMLNEGDPLIAVVGATDDPEKFGWRIYRDLKAKGFRVYPVNRRRATVDGDPAFADLAALPLLPDLVNIVVPPHETLRVLDRCEELGLRNVWLQPGAADEAVYTRLASGPYNATADACIMVRSRPKVTDRDPGPSATR